MAGLSGGHEMKGRVGSSMKATPTGIGYGRGAWSKVPYM
jgi:hypothetical protein